MIMMITIMITMMMIKSKVKVIAQDHIVGPISYCTHIPFVLCQIIPPIPDIQLFRIWPWWKSKVRSWMTPHLFRSMSIDHAIPGLQLFQNLILKIQGYRHNSVTKSVQLPIISHHLCSMSIGYPIPGIQLFKIWPWKYKVKITAQVHIGTDMDVRLNIKDMLKF